MLRDLLNKRATLLARAQALVDKADSEGRDMNEDERSEFNQIMGAGDDLGQLGNLDAQIERIRGEREKLRQAAAKEFNATGEDKGAEKPDGQRPKAMKRAEFDKLDPSLKSAFLKNGGKVED